MNTIIILLVSTIAATSAMTLFSYVISSSFKQLYKEPLLLKYVITRFGITISNPSKEILAWFIHYAIGFIFVLSYYFLWHFQIVDYTVINGFILGAISGMIGIAGWVVIFNVSGFYKKADDEGYYIQLFIAHIIFGITAIIVLSSLTY